MAEHTLLAVHRRLLDFKLWFVDKCIFHNQFRFQYNGLHFTVAKVERVSIQCWFLV